jgi:hypothetical protein
VLRNRNEIFSFWGVVRGRMGFGHGGVVESVWGG